MQNEINQVNSQNTAVLDQFLAVSKETTLNNLDLKDLANQVLKTLAEKERSIVEYRYGLSDKPISSLAKIGKTYNLTRERVRQIQAATIKKLKENKSNQNILKPLNDLIYSIIKENGGLISRNNLNKQIIRNQSNSENILIFLLDLNDEIKFVTEKPKTKTYLKLATKSDLNIEEIITKAKEILKSADKPMNLETITKQLELIDSQSIIATILEISKEIIQAKNLYGLNIWPEINPKSVNAKISFVLKDYNKPAHFKEITKMVQAISPNRTIKIPAVHNELVKDKRFILVGRGIYALSDWGYEKGTVKDILTKILKDKSPLSEKEIIDEVLKIRQVKRSTIKANIRNSQIFKNTANGYILKEA